MLTLLTRSKQIHVRMDIIDVPDHIRNSESLVFRVHTMVDKSLSAVKCGLQFHLCLYLVLSLTHFIFFTAEQENRPLLLLVCSQRGGRVSVLPSAHGCDSGGLPAGMWPGHASQLHPAGPSCGGPTGGCYND